MTKPSDLDLLDTLRAESRGVFQQKNAAYGGAYELFGALGVIIRMGDKLLRAFTLLMAGADEADERLRDTLLDLENYATIARICEARGNLRGFIWGLKVR